MPRRVMAQRLDRAFAIALGEKHKGQGCSGGGFGIDLAIPDKDRWPAAKAFDSGAQPGRIRLVLRQAVATDHGIEYMVNLEGRKDGAGRALGLVGADAKGMASNVQSG